jgi:hypothetical protein
LIIDAARSARADAQRLRADTDGLKLTLRASSRASKARIERAKAAAEIARVRRAVPCASPWSGLRWLRDDEALHTALVPVD